MVETLLIKLISAIKKPRPDVLISIDHEGGRVQRAKTDGFTHLPAMRRLGEPWGAKSKSQHPAESAAIAMAADSAMCWYLSCALVGWILVLRQC